METGTGPSRSGSRSREKGKERKRAKMFAEEKEMEMEQDEDEEEERNNIWEGNKNGEQETVEVEEEMSKREEEEGTMSMTRKDLYLRERISRDVSSPFYDLDEQDQDFLLNLDPKMEELAFEAIIDILETHRPKSKEFIKEIKDKGEREKVAEIYKYWMMKKGKDLQRPMGPKAKIGTRERESQKDPFVIFRPREDQGMERRRGRRRRKWNRTTQWEKKKSKSQLVLGLEGILRNKDLKRGMFHGYIATPERLKKKCHFRSCSQEDFQEEEEEEVRAGFCYR